MSDTEWTVDITNMLLGETISAVHPPIETCAKCGRNGVRLLDYDKMIHVITGGASREGLLTAPFWCSDLCDLIDGEVTLSEPALSLPSRIKHPDEVQCQTRN